MKEEKQEVADSRIPITLLGQAGCRLQFPGVTVYLDPYLSDSVQELENHDMRRLKPVPIHPEEVTDADWVFISHDHLDHCDPHTLPPLAKASPDCLFSGPPPVLELLVKWGIKKERLVPVVERWSSLSATLRVHAAPAAHPVVVRINGCFTAVGFVFDYQERHIYYAGDTGVTSEIIDALSAFAPLDTMLLPVNEQNFFRSANNIIGNMSIREAFIFAEKMQAKRVIPLHWDMFAENAVYPDEMEAVYHHMRPDFEFFLDPTYI